MADKQPRVVKARDNELHRAGVKTLIWTLVMREGTTFEDVLKPEYWTSLARTLGVKTDFHPLIHVVNDEHTFSALLYVRSVQENQVFVEVINGPHVFGPVEEPAARQLIVRWNVGNRTFEVVRAVDKQVIRGGFGVKEQALEWIDEHLKSVAA